MTDQQLRDLLEERVADVTMPDVSTVAWRDGRRSRRRDRLAVAGAAGSGDRRGDGRCGRARRRRRDHRTGARAGSADLDARP